MTQKLAQSPARARAAPAATTGRVEIPLHPAALIAVALVSAACLVVSVSFRIHDPDIWENLLVGKAIWQLHRAPTLHLWSWPTYGAPDLEWTWGFSALIWPIWERGGVWGLFAWRWVTVLSTFGLLWAAARRMGARGLAALVVMVACGLVWRVRSQVRPETLAGVLLALQLWILETRRQGGPDRSPWLIPVAWVWANIHNTWFIGLGLTGIHLLHDLVTDARRPRGRAGAERGAGSRGLGWIALGALLISFVNPYGWRALWQPFDFFLNQRNEAIFSVIGEMGAIDWGAQWHGLPILLVAWPVLLLARARRKGFDWVEALPCLLFSALALRAQRFLGFYALLAAPYLARDLAHVLPAWSGIRRVPVALRAALAALACVALALPESMRRDQPIGVGFAWDQYPVAACDFMEAHGVRGRGFTQFEFAGYQLFRFWPDRTRLPFMDIHQSGTRLDRDQYAWALRRVPVWRELDQRYTFDYVLLGRDFQLGTLRDVLDADSTWAPVFLDDVMALYVRRAGPLADVARAFEYQILPGGEARLGPLGQACARDSAIRARTKAELEREASSSPSHAHALILLTNLAIQEERYADARALLERALALEPNWSGTHLRLAMVQLMEGRPRDALREVGLERRLSGESAQLDLLAGRAWRELGDPGRARAAFRRAIQRDPANAEARDSLASIARGDRG